MSNDQFVGIVFILLLIMIIVEIGMLTICDYLKKIKSQLEKDAAKQPTKGE